MTWDYLDLFSGIGGFRLGLEWAGFKFGKEYHSDIEDYPNKVYALRFPESKALGDITKINPETLGNIDIITAGFPCQDLSVAGKQGGIHADRSGLFDEIIRISRVCRPKYIIFENVANLISRPEWIGYVLGRIAEIGYDAEWHVVRAWQFGAAHARARVFIVAYPSCVNAQSSPEQGRVGTTPLQFRGLSRGTGKTKWQNDTFQFKPLFVRKDDGIPCVMDRLKCLGNSIVPQIAEFIGRQILNKEKHESCNNR